MGRITGFLEVSRELPAKRPVGERLRDWRELEGSHAADELRAQASRCMDCAVPFCHKGCPLGNVIPDWNDLVYRNRWREAIDRLHATNNFPELTGRVCPAPCEEACVLALSRSPVTIKQIEKQIIDRAFEEGWISPLPPIARTGKRVAVVGSGPAGLACAQQLARAGHSVVVLERADRLGGLLRYGIPDFKLEKWQIDRRLRQLEAEGVELRTGVNVGVDLSADRLRAEFDAVCLAGGATRARELDVPGRELAGIHLAMEYLPQQNRLVAGDTVSAPITAAGKRVIVLGGGDTGSDCLGTALRQGAAAVHQIELLPRPPDVRPGDPPWPAWPTVLRSSSSHEEGGHRDWSVVTKRFAGDASGRVTHLHAIRAAWSKDADGRMRMTELPGTELAIECDLVLLALGFLGPERGPLLEDLGVALDARGAVGTDASQMTSVPGVFACGDMRRGQSLVVWAIWEGREAARGIDAWLRGRSELPTTPA